MNRLDRMFLAGMAVPIVCAVVGWAAVTLLPMWLIGPTGVVTAILSVHLTQRWALRTRREGL